MAAPSFLEHVLNFIGLQTIQESQPGVVRSPLQHGQMAPSTRRHKLVCFYCNKRTGSVYDGLITQFECAKCDAINFLDENGEITDPPVATDSIAPLSVKYALTRPDSPPVPVTSFGTQDSDVFCSTCLQNQHLYRSCLAQLDVETDPYHPDYRKDERAYYKYKKTLERNYPQVCADCLPKVEEHLKVATKTAKTDHFRRMLDRSKARRARVSSGFSFTDTLEFLGRYLWCIGIVGQLLLNIASILHATFQTPISNLIQPIFESVPFGRGLLAALPVSVSSLLALLTHLISHPTSRSAARFNLVCSVASIWWNPMFKSSVNSLKHVKGFGEWYKSQALLLVTRSLFYFMMGSSVLSNQPSTVILAMHFFMFCFVTLFTILARRALKVDTTPLWKGTPEKIIHVGPSRSRSSSEGSDTMADELNRIANSAPLSSRRPATPPSPLVPSYTQQGYQTRSPPQSPPIIQQQQSYPSTRAHQPSSFRSSSNTVPLFTTGRSTPSLLEMSPEESTRYLQFGEIPARLQEKYSNNSYDNAGDEMEWTPSAPQSQFRAFNTPQARLLQQTPQTFNHTPAGDEPSPFWYKVPAAPITPAQRLRNPPNQPRLRVASQEVKQEFFNNNAQQKSTFGSQARVNVDFAQQKFFPPTKPSEEGSTLADMLGSFSLSEERPEAPPTAKSGRLMKALLVMFIIASLAWVSVKY